jgi:hypothetical protein
MRSSSSHPIPSPGAALSFKPQWDRVFGSCAFILLDRRNFPNHRGPLIVLLVLLSLIQGATLAAQSLDPIKPPAGNFNLTNWYLGLPVDGSGGTNGASASISAATLTAGYSNALYFHTAADGAMVFWAFCNGATTSGSSYPRSELREQISPPSNSSNWIPLGLHQLNAQCRVTQVPSTGKVIIGQIHCYTGNARPLVKLQYNNGVIEALIKTNSNFDPDYKFYFQNVGLSNLVNYQIRMENGLITTTVNGSNQTINVFLTDPDWATNGLYFKAGSYCQDNSGTNDSEGARVAFYALARSHVPSVTNTPFSRTVLAGTNTEFSANALGNGPLRYQWLFNLTNALPGATNASLTVTNVQAVNAGVYQVRVTDNLGVTTNQIVTLTVIVPPSIAQQPTDQLVQAGANATLAVVANGTSPLAYRWYFNTNSPVTGGTNATLTISNALITAAGTYSIVVSNAAGTIQSVPALLRVNRPPVPGAVSATTGQAIPISITKLLSVAADPDGDGLSLSSVNSATANGGMASLSNSVVTYAPAAGFVGLDNWNYVLADTRGGSATGTVSVTVVASNAIVLTPISQALLSNGTFTADFMGVAGLTYSVDRATNIDGPWDLGFTNLTADTNGVFSLHDPNPPAAEQRFYRARYP